LAREASRPWTAAQEAPLQLAVFGSWIVGFGAAALFEYAPNASLWFPPAAVTFSAILVLGPRAFPVLWLGCLLVTILADQVFQPGLGWLDMLASGLAFAASHTVVYGGSAMLLRRFGGENLERLAAPQILGFLLMGVVACGLSSALGGLSLLGLGQVQLAELPPLIVTWWIGDYAGLVTVAPLFAVLLSHLAARLDAPLASRMHRLRGLDRFSDLWPEAARKLAWLALLAASILLASIGFGDPRLLLGLLALAPLQIWLLQTEADLATLTGVFGLTLLIATAVSTTALSDAALYLQFFVIAVAAGSYLTRSMNRSG
jgi:hypothetical protein